jgi:hypothetical protein
MTQQDQQPKTIFEQLASAIGTTNANVVDLYDLTRRVADEVAAIRAMLLPTQTPPTEPEKK